MCKLVTDVKVIPDEEIALQHQLLDMRIGVAPKSKRKFTPRLKVWKLKYHYKQLFPEGLQLACSSTDSRRAVVSFWQKNVHNTG